MATRARLVCHVLNRLPTHPQLSEEEAAAGLGPEWPPPRVLAQLQRQAVALSHEAVDALTARGGGPPGGGGGPRGSRARAARLCATLLGVLATTARLLVGLGRGLGFRFGLQNCFSLVWVLLQVPSTMSSQVAMNMRLSQGKLPGAGTFYRSVTVARTLWLSEKAQ